MRLDQWRDSLDALHRKIDTAVHEVAEQTQTFTADGRELSEEEDLEQRSAHDYLHSRYLACVKIANADSFLDPTEWVNMAQRHEASWSEIADVLGVSTEVAEEQFRAVDGA